MELNYLEFLDLYDVLTCPPEDFPVFRFLSPGKCGILYFIYTQITSRREEFPWN